MTSRLLQKYIRQFMIPDLCIVRFFFLSGLKCPSVFDEPSRICFAIRVEADAMLFT